MKRPSYTARSKAAAHSFRARQWLLFSLLIAGAAALIGRAVELQLVDHGFLAKQGDARYSRVAAARSKHSPIRMLPT